jgi:hypothetical protein
MAEKSLKTINFSFFSFSEKTSPSCENLQDKKKKKKKNWLGWGNLVATDKEICHGKLNILFNTDIFSTVSILERSI